MVGWAWCWAGWAWAGLGLGLGWLGRAGWLGLLGWLGWPGVLGWPGRTSRSDRCLESLSRASLQTVLRTCLRAPRDHASRPRNRPANRCGTCLLSLQTVLRTCLRAPRNHTNRPTNRPTNRYGTCLLSPTNREILDLNELPDSEPFTINSRFVRLSKQVCMTVCRTVCTVCRGSF